MYVCLLEAVCDVTTVPSHLKDEFLFAGVQNDVSLRASLQRFAHPLVVVRDSFRKGLPFTIDEDIVMDISKLLAVLPTAALVFAGKALKRVTNQKAYASTEIAQKGLQKSFNDLNNHRVQHARIHS